MTLTKVRRHGANLSSKIGTMLDAERAILQQYELSYIKEAVLKRKLNREINIVDYVTVLFKLDQWDEGFKELNELVDKGKDYYNIFFHLGLYYLKQKDFKQARCFFEKTVSIKSDHGAALNNLGALCLLGGDEGRAKMYLEHALEYFPAYLDAKHNYRLLVNSSSLSLGDLKFTWRELRKVLTVYDD